MYHHPFPSHLFTALRAALFVVAMFACAGVSSSLVAVQVVDDLKDSKVSAPRASGEATLLGTGPRACHEVKRPSSAVRPAPVQRSQRSEDGHEDTTPMTPRNSLRVSRPIVALLPSLLVAAVPPAALAQARWKIDSGEVA